MEETLEQRETTAAGKLYWAKRNCKVITQTKFFKLAGRTVKYNPFN